MTRSGDSTYDTSDGEFANVPSLIFLASNSLVAKLLQRDQTGSTNSQ